MNVYRFILVFCLLTAGLCAQRKDDFHLRSRAQISESPVFSPEDLKQLAKQGATLDAIGIRLNTIDENVKDIKKTLDKDVLPTIHVFDFLKWIFGLILVALVGVVVSDWWSNRRARQAPAN